MGVFEQKTSRPAEKQNMVIHPQMEIGAKDDPAEKEADLMSDKVMRMTDNESDSTARPMKEEDDEKVRMMSDEEDKNLQPMKDEEVPVRPMNEGGGGMIAPQKVQAAIQNSKGSGQSLPVNVQQDLGSKMGADFSEVKIHTGAEAHNMNESINAKAFTHGKDIYFKDGNYNPGSPGGKKLLAHELTHTMQGGGAVRMTPQYGDSGRVAKQGAALRSSPVKKKEDPYGNIIADLDAGDAVLIHEKSNGYLKVTVTKGGKKLTGYVSAELIVNFSEDKRETDSKAQKQNVLSGDQFEINNPNAVKAIFYCSSGGTLHAIAISEVSDISPNSKKVIVDAAKLKKKFIQKGITPTSISVVFPGEEGYEIMYTLYLQENNLPASSGPMVDPQSLLDKIAQSHTNASLTPGPWNPPGNQPPPFYIGNEAHKAIAAYYSGMHLGEVVFSNFIPIGTILADYQLKGFKVNWAKISALEMLAKPDILNQNLEQLYEIKPWGSMALAAAEAAMYVSIMNKAGIPMMMGNSMDRGVIGVVPAPGGFYVFTSPAPGVIIYKYQKNLSRPVQPYPFPVFSPKPITNPRFVPVTKPVYRPNPYTVPLADPSPEPGIWDMKYWEEVTGLTGAALIIYLIISEGSRLFPPRNLVPIP